MALSHHSQHRHGYNCLVYLVFISGVSSYVNVALNRPAIQSSQFSSFEPGTLRDGDAKKAVDGNNNSTYTAGSCSHTDYTFHLNWWMVDLLREEKIQAVKVTNRDRLEERLQNFTVKITKWSPYGNDSDVSSLPGELCTFVLGPIGQSKTELLPCEKPTTGRYVYIAKFGFGALTLCEFEALVSDEDGFQSKSVKKEGSYIKTNEVISKSAFQSIFNVSDILSCGAICQTAHGYNISTWIQYQRSNKRCDCVQYSPLVDHMYPINITPDSDTLCSITNF